MTTTTVGACHALLIEPAASWTELTRRLRPTLGAVSGHQRLRGSFSAAGALLRLIGPDLIETRPDLARRHDIEILMAAPELGTRLVNRRETLTSRAEPQTRTRYYPHDRVRWIGNGLTDLLLDYSAGLGPQSLLVTDVEALDPSDAEWLTGLVRRSDPARLQVILASRTEVVPAPLQPSALVRLHLPDLEASSPGDAAGKGRSQISQAREYVRGECLSVDPSLVTSYQQLPPAERMRLHDHRAAELAGDPAWLLGALPFHLQRGSAAGIAGVEAVEAAQARALMNGLYPTVVDHGNTLRRTLTWVAEPERRWLATVKMTIAHQAMAEPDHAMELFDEACAESSLPSIHMQCAYGRAMVYTRYYEPGRQDLRKARGHIHTAVALAQLSPNEERRAYNRTFNENGLALVEMRLGHLDAARQAIEQGIERLDAEVANGRFLLHRSVLRYNHAQLTARDGSVNDALAEFDQMVAEDPYHPDYYFDRAGLLERSGRLGEAIADYSRAAEVGPPYPEPYYNRAELQLRLGNSSAALADYGRVLDLEPTFIDALVNRAALLVDIAEFDRAQVDIDAGLILSPENPHLLTLRGQLSEADGDLEDALLYHRRAVAADPSQAVAWANLGAVSFALGNPSAAVDALEQSLRLADNPDVRENLALVRGELTPVGY